MFPSQRQLLILALAILAGTVLWVRAEGVLRAEDQSSGLSLVDAHGGVVKAGLIFLAAGVPVIVLGVIASATGNPLAGVFTAAVSLAVVAARGGPMDGWFWRRAGALPGAYWGLAGETVLWFLCGALFYEACLWMHWPLRRRLPTLIRSEPNRPGRSSWGEAAVEHEKFEGHKLFARSWLLGHLAAMLVSALVSGVIAWLLLRGSQTGQVVGSLVVAGAIGGVAGGFTYPSHSALGTLLGPGVVAVVGYVAAATRFSTGGDVLAAWYSRGLTGPALALPIFYASAGVAGCALGVGWAQVFLTHGKAKKGEGEGAGAGGEA